MYKGELGTANAHKILLKDIGKLFLPEAPVPHCLIEVQWGSYTTNNRKYLVQLPISYTSWFSPFMSVENAAMQMIGYLPNNLSSFTIQIGAGDNKERNWKYFTIGK